MLLRLFEYPIPHQIFTCYFRIQWWLLPESITTMIYVYTWIYCSMDYNYCDHFFKFPNYLKFGQWNPFQAMLLLDMGNHLLSTSLFYIFMFILYFTLTQSWNQSFLQGVLIPLSGKWYLETKIWVLGVLLHLL